MVSAHLEAGVPERRQHILVIDGAPAVLNLMQDIFQDTRFTVTTTNFVPHCFDQAAALQPDALIVDVAIGQRAGWDLLEALHEAADTTGIPVLLVSTSSALLKHARAQAARYGAHRYLRKPFDVSTLLKTMQEMTRDA